MPKPSIRTLVAATFALGLAGAAQAATVFQDDFSNTTNPVPGAGGYAIATGSVTTPNMTYSIGATTGTGNFDIVDSGYAPGICDTGAARCLDLDGTSAGLNSYLYTSALPVSVGQQYTMTVRVGGNRRNGGADNFIFGFMDSTTNDAILGAYEFVKNLDSNSPFQDYTVSYTATSSALKLFVQNATAEPKYSLYDGLPLPDNNGPMLQSITLTAVPLPAAAWLLLSGLAGVGVFARRRRVAAA